MAIDVFIIKNNDVIINEDILNSIQANPLALNIDANSLNYLVESFNTGKQISLNGDGSREVYEIHYNDELAGVILLEPQEDPEAGAVTEIIIFVFEQFQGNGISKKAMEQLLELESNTKLLATIHQENIAKEGLVRLFQTLGFKPLMPNEDYVAYLRKI